jgi:hypothetical protein
MKYLKIYENFKTFSDNFYNEMDKTHKEYQEKLKNIRQNFKDEVDEYMYFLTDNWGFGESFIENDDPIVHYELRFKHNEVEKVYEELKMINFRLKSDLALEIIVDEIYRGVSKHRYLYSGLNTDLETSFLSYNLRGSTSGVKFNNPLLDEELEEKRLKISIWPIS